MPKRITVAEHSNIEELEQLYKQATGGVESRKAHALEASPGRLYASFRLSGY